MAKNSGTTRRAAPGGNEGGGNGQSRQVDKFLTPARMDEVADFIASAGERGFLSFERDMYEDWQNMTTDEKDLTLMLAGFTGMINDEYEEFGTIYTPTDKKGLISEIEEALDNEWTGQGMEESTVFTIGYKDGSTKRISLAENDFEPKQRITPNTSSREIWRRARAAIGLSNVAYIVRTNGYDEPNYWVANEDGKAQMKEYFGFEEWKKGRGEKRRSYIQDDWI